MKDITVFTRSSCAPCRTLKRWLQYKGLTYREYDIDTDTEACAEAFRQCGYSIVPLTIVTAWDGSKKTIPGCNIPALSALL